MTVECATMTVECATMTVECAIMTVVNIYVFLHIHKYVHIFKCIYSELIHHHTVAECFPEHGHNVLIPDRFHVDSICTPFPAGYRCLV